MRCRPKAVLLSLTICTVLSVVSAPANAQWARDKTESDASKALPFIMALGSRSIRNSCKIGLQGTWRFCRKDDHCFVWTDPVTSIMTRNGRIIAPYRGDVAIIVTWRKYDFLESEFFYLAGYPIGLPPTVSFASMMFDLKYNRDIAHAQSPEMNQSLVERLKAGNIASVKSTTTRRTAIHDKFSVIGLNEALTRANKLCV